MDYLIITMSSKREKVEKTEAPCILQLLDESSGRAAGNIVSVESISPDRD